MLKNYWPLVVFFLILFGIVSMSQYAEHSKSSYEKSHTQVKSASIAENKDGKPSDHANEAYKPPVWAKYVTFPEGLGAWAVVLTLFAVVWQSIETRKAAEASDRGYRLSLGVTLPKLAIHELSAHTVDGNPINYFQHPRVNIEIKNYGTSPALLEFWCLCFCPEELPEEPIYTGPATGMVLEKKVVHAGEVFSLPHPSFLHRQTFTEETAIGVANRDFPFYVYGFIAYRDIFGSPLKRLKFCERMLNVWGGENMCDWWERLSPPGYTGIEDFPFRRRTHIKARIRLVARWMKNLADEDQD
jgi:hypothetical protein